jgi:hypothetical protein
VLRVDNSGGLLRVVHARIPSRPPRRRRNYQIVLHPLPTARPHTRWITPVDPQAAGHCRTVREGIIVKPIADFENVLLFLVSLQSMAL